MSKHHAIHMRVGTKRQDTASQEPELKRWAQSHEGDSCWHQDSYIRRLTSEGGEIAAIARATGLSRPTIYRILAQDCNASSGFSDGRSVSRVVCGTGAV
jgi:DNA invertase Pin-like site-specific DNA recombinase